MKQLKICWKQLLNISFFTVTITKKNAVLVMSFTKLVKRHCISTYHGLVDQTSQVYCIIREIFELRQF